MKKSYLLAFLLPFGFACNSSFKNMQTPDDVYYSPAVLRTENTQHDNTHESTVTNNSSPVLINNSNNAYYTDNYYLNRRRRYYYKRAEMAENIKTVAVPRTTNLGGYNNNKSTTPVNPKISGVPVTPTSNGHQPTRTFKKTSGTAVGNAIRKIVNSDLGLSNTPTYSTNNNNNQSSSTPTQTKTSTSTSAPTRSFGKKN